tara:strand:+ start:405 stop:623 length:219 start_codon:yes stop_codon:yes gene_type:complete
MTKEQLELEVERLTKENERLKESVEIFKEGLIKLAQFTNNPAVDIVVDIERFKKIERFRKQDALQKAYYKNK